MDFTHLRWRPVPAASGLELLGPGAPVGTARDRPDHDPALIPRDWAIYLLHAAAEIEHALLVQYLYAWLTLNPDGAPDAATKKKVRLWKSTLLGIAKEEMGHLISVQNLLILLGGPIHYERETFPIPSEFYPFPFELEPLTRESLAKYVLAEMPERPNPPLPADLFERAQIDAAGRNINRVGALYARLYCIFSKGTETGLWLGCDGYPKEDHLGDDDFAKDFASYQADQKTWAPLPADPKAFRILIPPAMDRDHAREAIKEIGEQGEGMQGTGVGGELSHFERFRAIYEDKDFPETDPELGPITWRVSYRVPKNPNTRTGAKRDEGTIGHPRSRKWAQLFNFRYRLLLAYLTHYSQVDERNPDQAGRREELRKLAIGEMLNLQPISDNLVTLPFRDEGDTRRAGPPFELPYTLDLPIREPDRWRRHLDALADADNLIALIQKEHPQDAQNQTLKDLLTADSAIQKRLSDQMNKPIRMSPASGATGSGGGAPASGGAVGGGAGGGGAHGPAPGGVAATAGGPTGVPPGSVHWPRVKQILDGAIADWKAKHGRDPLLKQKHGPKFGWDAKADLAAAVARIGGTEYRLIDPSLVGSDKGWQTNLVVALSNPDGVDSNGQMPNDGPYLTDTHPTYISEIIQWINDGMPD